MGNIKYTESHEWVKLEDGIAIIGISNHAQEELGDIVFVEVSELGENVSQFDEIGSIESVKAVTELKSPVSGEIIEINPELSDHPEILNKEPYDNGWILKIKISDESELDNLMDQSGYEDFIKEE